MTREEAITYLNVIWNRYKAEYEIERETLGAYHMAIEALSEVRCNDCKWNDDVIEVVRCKDCRHANECNKSVQYTRNEPNTVTIGYTKIDFCSHGERREP